VGTTHNTILFLHKMVSWGLVKWGFQAGKIVFITTISTLLLHYFYVVFYVWLVTTAAAEQSAIFTHIHQIRAHPTGTTSSFDPHHQSYTLLIHNPKSSYFDMPALKLTRDISTHLFKYVSRVDIKFNRE